MKAPYKQTFRVSQTFNNPRAGRGPHQGLDLVGIQSKELYSIVDGVVVRADWESPGNHAQGWGLRVVIRISGTNDYLYYGHMASIAVQAGQKVSVGTQLGIEGNTGCSTGSHLHIEIREGDMKAKYKDVAAFIGIPNEKNSYTPTAPGRGSMPTLGTATLKVGSRGAFVMDLQKILNVLYDADLAYDEIFGRNTEAILKEAQRKLSVAADGKCGAKTRAALQKAWEE